MGASLWQCSAAARHVFEAADKAMGMPLSQVCFDGPADRLTDTAFAQPGVVAVSLAAAAALAERLGAENAKLAVSFCAGHSVGEFAALAHSGAVSLESAFELVAARGKAMAEASAVSDGSMVAVMGLDEAALVLVCARASEATGASVQVANLNAPGQVVISGNRRALARACDLAREAGAKRTVNLDVSGPFHSTYMQPAADKFEKPVHQAAIVSPTIPIVLNVTAQACTDAVQLRREMVEQVTSPVRWAESVLTMWDMGCTVFVELGPGQVLSGLIKRTARGATVMNVEDEETLHKTVASIVQLL
jgi:[acyl-carrier-protein] S-malonyltransferase